MELNIYLDLYHNQFEFLIWSIFFIFGRFGTIFNKSVRSKMNSSKPKSLKKVLHQEFQNKL